MPFIGGPEVSPAPPAKRRKFSSRMDDYHTNSSEDIDEQFLFEPSEAQEDGSGSGELDRNNAEKTIRTSDREELIQCIKRGQRTTWVPKPGLEALCAEISAELNASSSGASAIPRPKSEGPSAPDGDAGASTIRASPKSSSSSAADALRHSLDALRTGDPFEDFSSVNTAWKQNCLPRSDGQSTPWRLDFPPSRSFSDGESRPTNIIRRSRAPSLGSSLSSSFVRRIPTSPLVQATNNPTLDFSPKHSAHTPSGQSARRRTMPPNAFDSLHMSPLDSTVPNFSRPLAHDRVSTPVGDSFVPGHRPRRSLSSFTYQPITTSQMPAWSKQRRRSLAADTSPQQRASMVGSFEESILRGRMSTPPSKPFDFVAQIGVMGKGDCPSSLKCPAHVNVPFPAVYYSYSSANSSRSISDDNPSPYVGSIDLDRNLKAPEEPRRRLRRSQASLNPEELAAEITKPENTAIGIAVAQTPRQTQEKVAFSPKAPHGGAYRVPQQGQLQVIIKNPNKTAVKLFLIPYNLEGMLPGTKTFVRQRSYSSDTMLEAVISEKQAMPSAHDSLCSKDILRYMIHLKFYCLARGRFYLYDNIRVVFANRMLDGREQLRNDVQLPEPRFSPYKFTSEFQSPSQSISDEKYSPILQYPATPDFEDPNGRDIHFEDDQESSPSSFHLRSSSNYDLGLMDTGQNAPGEQVNGNQFTRTISPVPGFVPSTSARGSPVPWSNADGALVGRSFSPAPIEAGHGLLSQKLREINDDPGRRSD